MYFLAYNYLQYSLEKCNLKKADQYHNIRPFERNLILFYILILLAFFVNYKFNIAF